jgi:hypothetical protein
MTWHELIRSQRSVSAAAHTNHSCCSMRTAPERWHTRDAASSDHHPTHDRASERVSNRASECKACAMRTHIGARHTQSAALHGAALRAVYLNEVVAVEHGQVKQETLHVIGERHHICTPHHTALSAQRHTQRTQRTPRANVQRTVFSEAGRVHRKREVEPAIAGVATAAQNRRKPILRATPLSARQPKRIAQHIPDPPAAGSRPL